MNGSISLYHYIPHWKPTEFRILMVVPWLPFLLVPAASTDGGAVEADACWSRARRCDKDAEPVLSMLLLEAILLPPPLHPPTSPPPDDDGTFKKANHSRLVRQLESGASSRAIK